MKNKKIVRLLVLAYFIVGFGLIILLLGSAPKSIVFPLLKVYILSSPVFVGIANWLRKITNNHCSLALCLAISWAVLAAILMFFYFRTMTFVLLPWLLTYVVITPLVAIFAWFLK